MSSFITYVRRISTRHLERFVRARLQAELPAADAQLRRALDPPSRDPRTGDPPIIGVL